MSTTQQPEALNLEEFRAKVTHAAREPLLARIAELEAQLSAIGAGGVEPLRKSASQQEAHHAEGVPEQTETLRAELAEETEAADNWRRLALQFDHHRLQALGHLKAILHPDSSVDEYKTAELFLKAPPLDGESVLAQRIAELSATPQAQAVKLLAADHSGMKVDYRGLFSQVQRALKRTDPGYAEMLRQLESHLQELGQRWYAGDTDVVDEMLQLYCIECDARKTVSASATEAPQAQADARDVQMWAPIDTAPKDGSWIQLWREPEKKIGDCAPLVFGRWHDEYESWVWPDHAHYDPFTERGIERANSDIEAGNAFSTDAFTHWRPLGKPAIADQAKQGGVEHG